MAQTRSMAKRKVGKGKKSRTSSKKKMGKRHGGPHKTYHGKPNTKNKRTAQHNERARATGGHSTSSFTKYMRKYKGSTGKKSAYRKRSTKNNNRSGNMFKLKRAMMQAYQTGGTVYWTTVDGAKKHISASEVSKYTIKKGKAKDVVVYRRNGRKPGQKKKSKSKSKSKTHKKKKKSKSRTGGLRRSKRAAARRK